MKREDYMTKEIRLTKAIHRFVRGQLTCQESIRLLEEIIESDKWLKCLETEMMLYDVAIECKSKSKQSEVMPGHAYN